VVMVYADYRYMLEKKEKVLQKKIALQIWKGPRLYTPCAKKHMCFVFFIVPSCPSAVMTNFHDHAFSASLALFQDLNLYLNT
jgi:hypothetical protein